MKVANMIMVMFLAFLIIGGCNEADDNNGGTTNPPTVTPAPPTPEPNPCPCEDGCCDSSGQCKSGEHCMTVPLTNSSQVAAGMECTYEVKGIDCMDCCNLNAARLKGNGPSPIRDNSTLERSNSKKDVAPDQLGTISGGWESGWDTAFGCSGNPIGCGNGDYTAVLTFEKGCQETVELCFRLP